MARADVMATSMLSKAVASFRKNVSKTYKKLLLTTVNSASNLSLVSGKYILNPC